MTSAKFIFVCGLAILIIDLISCKSTNPIGRYELRHFPKTYIDLKEDGTFEFVRINPNPYLHPFDHPEENYFLTKGNWIRKSGTLILQSFEDLGSTPQPEVIEMKGLSTKIDTLTNIDGEREIWSYSSFTFFDIFNDTVNILYAKAPDGRSLSVLHRSMKYLTWPTKFSDTLEFHFYGYNPYTFIRNSKDRKVVKIKLYPEYRTNVFENRVLEMKSRKIKYKGIKFDKVKIKEQ